MKAIRNRRALATALACCLVPVLTILFGKLLNQLGAPLRPVLPILSYLIWLMPSALFFLALVLPHLDMLAKRLGPASAALFYKPLLKSVAYYVVAGAGIGLCYMLIFIIPFFLFVAILPVLAILYFYFLGMTKLAFRFLGRENSSYGGAINYHLFARCGLLAVVVTFTSQMLVPFEIRRFISSELFACLGGMVGVGYMVGRALQAQYDEEQFYLENFPEEEVYEH